MDGVDTREVPKWYYILSLILMLLTFVFSNSIFNELVFGHRRNYYDTIALVLIAGILIYIPIGIWFLVKKFEKKFLIIPLSFLFSLAVIAFFELMPFKASYGYGIFAVISIFIMYHILSTLFSKLQITEKSFIKYYIVFFLPYLIWDVVRYLYDISGNNLDYLYYSWDYNIFGMYNLELFMFGFGFMNLLAFLLALNLPVLMYSLKNKFSKKIMLIPIVLFLLVLLQPLFHMIAKFGDRIFLGETYFVTKYTDLTRIIIYVLIFGGYLLFLLFGKSEYKPEPITESPAQPTS